MTSEVIKRQHHHIYRPRAPVAWAVGEREALIVRALAEGRAKQVPKGVSGYENPAAQPFTAGMKSY